MAKRTKMPVGLKTKKETAATDKDAGRNPENSRITVVRTV
jgi:hypothetical protein